MKFFNFYLKNKIQNTLTISKNPRNRINCKKSVFTIQPTFEFQTLIFKGVNVIEEDENSFNGVINIQVGQNSFNETHTAKNNISLKKN